jgi:serine/threonine protein kinase
MHNDIWSLGVILVNLTCGHNPWKQACPNDETFRAYLSNPDFLRSILPVSKQCNDLLKRIFALNPASRISIKDLKAEVKKMTHWTMSLEELKYATRATKEAARAWAPSWVLDDPSHPDAAPPKPPQPLPPQPKEVPQQPKTRPPRETVFDITDSSTISSVDSLQEWQAHQQQQQQFQQQIKRSHARLQGPHIPSPVSSPSASSACPEFPAPTQPPRARHAPPGPSAIRTPQDGIAGQVAVNLRSNFSLSDSDDATSDEDEEMDYVGRGSTTYVPPTKVYLPPQQYAQHNQSRCRKDYRLILIHSPSHLRRTLKTLPSVLSRNPHRLHL